MIKRFTHWIVLLNMNFANFKLGVWGCAAAITLGGCGGKPAATTAVSGPPHSHEHKPPHGGTPIVLGHEEFHIELVRDAAAGKLTAYVMDAELENYVRSTATAFDVDVVASPDGRGLVFQAIPNSATGEIIGDTAQFEAQADWLKTTASFDAVLRFLPVRAQHYTNVSFNFPKGNDHQ